MGNSVRLSDIYNLLFAGKRLQLSFPTSIEAEKFRIRMHQFKALQDRAQVSIGMITEEEKQRFIFRYDADTGIATLKFEDKADPRQYVITILEEEGNEEQDG